MLEDSQIDEQNDGLEPRPPVNFSKNQKMAAGGLAVFAFLIVILWLVQLKSNIYDPLNSSIVAPSAADSQTASDLELKNKDTDADGLSDYDELNIYKTSPYLADSDSDGVNDGAEVGKKTDPNCPEGRTCVSDNLLDASSNQGQSDQAQPSSENNVLNNIINQYSAVNSTLQPGAASGNSDLTDEQIQALENIDAAALRQLLIEAGMDKASLDQISDADLMQSYQEILKEQ